MLLNRFYSRILFKIHSSTIPRVFVYINGQGCHGTVSPQQLSAADSDYR